MGTFVQSFSRNDSRDVFTTATLSPGINQSFSTGVWTTVLFNFPGSFNQGLSMLNIGTSTFTIPFDGIYQIYAIIGWRVTAVPPTNTFILGIRIVKNGQFLSPIIVTRTDASITSITESQSIGYAGEFFAGDTFIIQVYGSSAGGGLPVILYSGDSSGGNQPGVMTFTYCNLLLPTEKPFQISNMSLITTGSLSANQAIPSGVWTTIIFNVASGDGQKAPLLNTTTGIYTIGVTGFYKLSCGVTWQSNSGPLVNRILRNGNAAVPIFNSTINNAVGTGAFDSQFFEFAAPLLVGDTITFQAWQGSGAPLNIYAVIDPSGGTQLGVATFSLVNLAQLPPT